MTATQLINTTIATGNFQNPVKHTFDTTSSVFALHMKLTSNGGPASPGDVKLLYSTSPFDLAALVYAKAARESAVDSLLFDGLPRSGESLINATKLQPLLGAYLYVWLVVPTFSVAPSLDLTVTED